MELGSPLPDGEDEVPLERHRLVEPVDEDRAGAVPAAPGEPPGGPGKEGAFIDEVVLVQEPEVRIEDKPDLSALCALEVAERRRIIHLPRGEDLNERRQLIDDPGPRPVPPDEEREVGGPGGEDIGDDEPGLRPGNEALGLCVILKDPPGEPGKCGDRVAEDGRAFSDEAMSDIVGEARRRDNENSSPRVPGGGFPEPRNDLIQAFARKTAVQDGRTHPSISPGKRLQG